MKWLNALAGIWVDLGPEELGSVKIDEKSITYSYKEPSGPYAFTCSTYLNISKDHFYQTLLSTPPPLTHG